MFFVFYFSGECCTIAGKHFRAVRNALSTLETLKTRARLRSTVKCKVTGLVLMGFFPIFPSSIIFYYSIFVKRTPILGGTDLDILSLSSYLPILIPE